MVFLEHHDTIAFHRLTYHDLLEINNICFTIKLHIMRQGSVKAFAGLGKPGQADGAMPSFYEPGGISIARDKLYVADSNNHAIAYAFVLIQKLMKVGSRVLFVRLVTKNAYLQVLIGWKSRRREPISNDRQSVPKTCAKNRCPASPAPVSVHTFRAAE